MIAKLTDKQKRFIEEYLIDLNATQAAIRAGYSAKTASRIAIELLNKTHVQAYLQERQQALQDKMDISQERVLAELAAIGFADATDFVGIEMQGCGEDSYPDIVIKPTDKLPKMKRAAIAGIKQGRSGIEIKLNDKLRALEQISRIMGYVKDSGTQPQTGDNGLVNAISTSSEEVFKDALFEVQPQTDAGADVVETPESK